MGCKSCGSKGKRKASNIPILDSNNQIIAKNYEKFKSLSKYRPANRVRLDKNSKPKANIKKNVYSNIIQIEFEKTRINVLTHDIQNKCIYIIGYMEGCGSCNYMKRLINKILTPDMKTKIHTYSLDKTITDPTGFSFTGNPTILFVDKGKLVFQVGGIFNKIGDKIEQYYTR